MKKNKLFLTFIIIFLGNFAFSQVSKISINKSYENIEIDEFADKIKNEKKINLYFIQDSIPKIKIKVIENNLLKTLISNYSKYKINVSSDNLNNIYLTKNKKLNTNLPATFYKIEDYEKKEKDSSGNYNLDYLKTISEFIEKTKIAGIKNSDNKKNATISGYLRNAANGEPIIACTMHFKEINKATVSNNAGYYKITLPKGEHTLIIKSIETGTEKFKLIAYSDDNIDFEINKKLVALDEVIVKSDRYDNVKSTRMGFEKISTKQISEIPSALGEKDIIKVTLLLPGINSVGEGSAGFNVRGSPADQNLFYINNMPIYNTSHLLGFFSAFNSDAIDEFSLYKSNIPAKYGGRLSSIFDIKTKSGNKNKFTASGGISPVTGRLLVEGPIIKNKLTFLLSFRSTYSDWILKRIKSPEINNSSAGFNDFIGNIYYNINEKNNIKLFSYYSSDKINLTGNNLFDYKNMGGSLNWARLINKKHKLSTNIIYSRYIFYSENTMDELYANKSNYELNHIELNSDMNIHISNNNEFNVGISSILYLIDYGKYLPYNDLSLISPIDFGNEKAIESSIYASNRWNITDKLSITTGIRLNNYMYLGKKTVFEYAKDAPKSIENITDTIDFNNNKIIKTYTNPDFRVGAKFLITDNISIKAGFNTLHQYVFMLSNTIAVSPTYKWKLSDYHIKPLSGNQYSVGLFTNIFNNKIELSLEAYYKKIKNLVEFKDGANLEVTKIPELDVLQGNLNSYGIEFMCKKPYGKLNGWINYTYSSAKVLVNNKFEEERINFGEPYSANYDKPHSFNVVVNYKLSRRLSVSANVVYSTGRPITLPVGAFYQNSIELLHYSKRNEYRVPDYFRTDMSIKLEGNLKKKKFAHGTWILSVYNITGRNNAYSVFFKTEEGNISGYKMSIFAIPVVSLSYNFKLGNYAD